MATETVVDTSVWAAILRGEFRSMPGLRRFDGSEAVAHVLTLAELESLEGRDRVPAGSTERVITAARIEPCLQRDVQTAGRLHAALRAQGRSKASLVDCILYAAAQRLGAPLVTLDGDLGSLPGVEGV